MVFLAPALGHGCIKAFSRPLQAPLVLSGGTPASLFVISRACSHTHTHARTHTRTAIKPSCIKGAEALHHPKLRSVIFGHVNNPCGYFQQAAHFKTNAFEAHLRRQSKKGKKGSKQDADVVGGENTDLLGFGGTVVPSLFSSLTFCS